MKGKRKMLIVLAVALALVASLVGCAAPTEVAPPVTPEVVTPTPEVAKFEPVHLTSTHQMPVDSAVCMIQHMFEDLCEEYTDGALTVTHFCEGEIYPNYYEMAIGCAAGEVDMGSWSQSGYVKAGVDELNMMATYGILQDKGTTPRDILDAFWAHPQGGQFLEQKIEAKGLKVLWFYTDPDPCIVFYLKDKMESVYDLAGLKIRSATAAGNRLFMEEVGMIFVGLPSSDIYMAAQTGLIDGCGTTVTGGVTRKNYEVLPWIPNYVLYSMINFVNMNLDKWQSLSPEMQKVIQEKIIPEARDKAVPIFAKEFDKYLDVLRTEAHFYELSEEAKAEIEAIFPTYWKNVGIATGLSDLIDVAIECREKLGY